MQHITGPKPEDLQTLLSRLQEEQYNDLQTLSLRVNAAIPTVRSQTGHTIDDYIDLSAGLAAQAVRYLRYRRLILIPYINDLLNKEDEGHDCRACSGSCEMRHIQQVSDVRAIHSRIREDMDKLRQAELQLISVSATSNAYTSLRADMINLEAALSGLLFIEESALVPMMLDLQRTIGAHG